MRYAAKLELARAKAAEDAVPTLQTLVPRTYLCTRLLETLD